MSTRRDLIEDLRARGVRVTPQRAIILEAIEGLSGHVTAEEIFSEVQRVNAYISLATVYRTLDLLQELGLVTESNMGTTTSHYALKTHGNHHHAVCRLCHKTIELPANFVAGISRRLRSDYHFIADDNHIVIFGWCERCYETINGD